MNKLTPKQLSEAVFQVGFEKGKAVARQEIIDGIKKGKICLNCGGKKEGKLTDWCSECLEKE
jgi:hypothetical protein